MKKRILALLFAVVMITSCFCGCGAKGSSSKKNDAELIGNTYVSGFPIVKEKEELNIMAVVLSSHGDFDEMSFTTTYEEMTNVDIKWTLVSSESIESSVSLALASNNLPDVMCILDNRIGDSVFLKYVEEGTFIQLDDLIGKFGGNISAMFDKYPQTKADITLSDGGIYSLPRVTMTSDNHMRFPYKLYMRKTWLDNLNLEVPKTTEEYYNVLSAFREDDPNGNGQNDEIPFAMAGVTNAYFGSWGLSFYSNSKYLSVTDDGKVEYAYATEACKKGLSFLNRMVNQGNAAIYDSNSKWQSKIRSGVVGAFYGLDKYTIAGDELGSEYVMIAPPSAEDGSTPTISVNNQITPNAFMITKACKNPETAMRWIDYFYSAEGAMLVNYGADGDKVTKNKDGLYEFVAENADVNRYTYTPGHAIPCLMDDAYEALFAKQSEENMTDREKFDAELIKETNNVLRGKFEPAKEIGVITLDKQAAAIEDQYLESIEEYAIKMINRFAKGEDNVDTTWSSYIAELEKKGLNELVAEYQRIYDAKNKE